VAAGGAQHRQCGGVLAPYQRPATLRVARGHRSRGYGSSRSRGTCLRRRAPPGGV